MSDTPERRVIEACPCGSTVDVSGPDPLPDLLAAVQGWRDGHYHGPPEDRRTGTGFAATQASSVPPLPRGHGPRDVRV